MATISETTDLSKQYDTPLGLAHTTMQALKDRIKQHYDLASDYYLNLWGEHIHHGYWPTDESKANDSKETAQLNLIRLLLSIADLPVPLTDGKGQEGSHEPSGDKSHHDQHPLRILDVGCGLGGTTRFLASSLGAAVTGITISDTQVRIASRLTENAAAAAAAASAVTGSADEGTGRSTPPNDARPGNNQEADGEGEGKKINTFIPLGPLGGKVRFLELDAEKMAEFFTSPSSTDRGGEFDIIWISEALSHLPDKPRFFRSAHRLLVPGGKLVVADWFKAERLSEAEVETDIKPIEDGMLLPALHTQADYIRLAEEAGLRLLNGPLDISKDVSKTWDISWSLVQNPSLWAFAFSQGRDGIAFLQAFRAMRRGYANGSFRYGVMAFVKD
ncbi:hypothetical protein VTJ49DRAFT_2115 [Mycothermus thermophilus]|uniref:Uncharacterized protein n=1 Tax=Humicola insolens TaxID=85995 RepID=A0ABR3VBE3_HUMIN